RPCARVRSSPAASHPPPAWPTRPSCPRPAPGRVMAHRPAGHGHRGGIVAVVSRAGAGHASTGPPWTEVLHGPEADHPGHRRGPGHGAARRRHRHGQRRVPAGRLPAARGRAARHPGPGHAALTPAGATTMRTTRRRMLVLAFAAGFLAVGLPYWSIPCDSPAFSLPSALPDAGLVVVGCMAALARVLSPAGLVRTTLAAGASVPAAVMAR